MAKIYKKAGFLISTAGLAILLYNNIMMDYRILADKQKPSFNEALSFINASIEPEDVFFFPIYMNYPNFLYYAKKDGYKQLLIESLKQNRNPLNTPDFSAQPGSIHTYITKLSLNHKRMWVIIVTDKILEREIFNDEYARAVVSYLQRNYRIVSQHKLKYIDIYLFRLSSNEKPS